ncbi:hypothetical protein PABG_00048 [Paracoccidioides brasiliensis Pb03]|nr:hypothetical protein PABG_00048 [Paracoccidioides brasiliensis Pb03]
MHTKTEKAHRDLFDAYLITINFSLVARTSTSNSSAPSKYQIVKKGWGDRKNFQHSYGLGMGVDDFEEGNAILDKMMEHDVENMKNGNN